MSRPGHEKLYLEDGMNAVDLFQAFNARNPYYRHIASRLVQIVSGQFLVGDLICDLLARTGYAARAVLPVGSDIRVTVVEHRSPFVEFLEGEFAPEIEKKQVMLSKNNVLDPKTPFWFPEKFDAILCCEQASLLLPMYRDVMLRISEIIVPDWANFGFTLGPSHHAFTTFPVADHRLGVVKDGEVMSELSHPIRQAVHAEVVLLAKKHFNFERDDAWPPAGKALAHEEILRVNDELGFQTEVIEEMFAIPGSQIRLYDQNGWTFYMRWPPLSELADNQKIALLKSAIQNVRKRKEYNDWCNITAHHPVAYYIVSR